MIPTFRAPEKSAICRGQIQESATCRKTSLSQPDSPSICRITNEHRRLPKKTRTSSIPKLKSTKRTFMDFYRRFSQTIDMMIPTPFFTGIGEFAEPRVNGAGWRTSTGSGYSGQPPRPQITPRPDVILRSEHGFGFFPVSRRQSPQGEPHGTHLFAWPIGFGQSKNAT